jgi:GNAT superfamily N-acetyltransferase
MTVIAYREALLGDAADIHALLLKLAPEIPILIDTLAREEALYALIRNCARSGESWVALDEAGGIVGFVLVEPNKLGRHYAEEEVLDLRHAGVAPEHRNRGIFGDLIEKILARMVPVTTTVSQQNRSGMARRLEQLGFRQTASPGGELHFRREPGKGA